MILIEADNLKQSADELIDFSISKGPINLNESFWEEYVKKNVLGAKPSDLGSTARLRDSPFVCQTVVLRRVALAFFHTQWQQHRWSWMDEISSFRS